MADKLANPHRVSPRLRMIVNGDDEVNSYRSLLSASVTAPDAALRDVEPLPRLRRAALPDTRDDRGALPEAYERQVRVSCFVQLERPDARPDALPERARSPGRHREAIQRDTIVIAELTRAQIERLAAESDTQGVVYVEPGVPLSHPRPEAVRRRSAAPGARIAGAVPAAAAGDSDVLIGLIDVGGFDFAHEDFLRGGRTRFHAIWDQGAREGAPPPGFDHGREITADEMNEAIRGAAEIGVAPEDILEQSARQPGSHGTHVASIAGGNHGVCPGATLAGVLIALDESELDRHRTFFDSTRLAQAVTYLFDLGARLGAERGLGRALPTVINVSLGTNGHAHDGTSPISRWIDSALSRPGRCVCVAAGNAGQEAPRFEGDLGFFSGRIHAAGRVPASGLDVDLEWQVVGNGIVDVSENEMEIWYEAGDEFRVSVRSPSGVWLRDVGPGRFYENHAVDGPDGPVPSQTFVSIYNERYHPANGANRISIFLSPRLKGQVRGIESGTWTVRLHGENVRDGRFDAWIERDDPRPLGRLGEAQAWLFPSYFSSRSNVDRSSVSSLACGRDVIAVGNSDPARERMNVSSSQGPTRDGRHKPDIAAPGTDIVAARGFSGGDARRRWVSMSGTSMASPYVAGVAARMLAVEPRLTAAQIQGIMRRTARPLPGSDYDWQDDAGFGEIRPLECIAHASAPFTAVDLADEEAGS